MIFLSHTAVDKPVVEPVAIALREIYGEAAVFYDAWSIRPGDGIIHKMNEGLKSPEFVFLFVSANSLRSEMVNLEWQTALIKATKGKCRLVPVRVDGTAMPPLLLQSLYIDMFTTGVEVATLQIVSVVQGNVSFTRQYSNFSNLTWSTSGDPKTKVLVNVSASHVMEPRPSFGFVLRNTLGEVGLWIEGAPAVRFENEREEAMPHGRRLLLFGAPFDGAPITPVFPLVFSLTPRDGATINLEAVLHKVSPTEYRSIPPGA